MMPEITCRSTFALLLTLMVLGIIAVALGPFLLDDNETRTREEDQLKILKEAAKQSILVRMDRGTLGSGDDRFHHITLLAQEGCLFFDEENEASLVTSSNSSVQCKAYYLTREGRERIGEIRANRPIAKVLRGMNYGLGLLTGFAVTVLS